MAQHIPVVTLRVGKHFSDTFPAKKGEPGRDWLSFYHPCGKLPEMIDLKGRWVYYGPWFQRFSICGSLALAWTCGKAKHQGGSV
jgi:hypothetical protein